MDRGSIACVFSMIEEATLSYFHEVVASFEALSPKYKVTGGRILLMKKRYLEVMLVTVCLCMATGSALGLEKIPDWLTGTLCIDMIGADSLDAEWPHDRYVCFFNFDDRRIDGVHVPDNSLFIPDVAADNAPAVVYPVDTSYEFEGGYSASKWRLFRSVTFRGKSENSQGAYSCDSCNPFWTEDQTNWDEFAKNQEDYLEFEFSLEAPLTVLGLLNGGSVYALEYGVSEIGELEIQLVFRNSDEKKVYGHFPLNYNFGHFRYSISLNGNIAWVDNNKIHATDDLGRVYVLKPNDIVGPVAWLNDDQILFLSKEKGSYLKRTGHQIAVWNQDSGEIHAIYSSLDDNINPLRAVINNDNTILAVYITHEFGGPSNIFFLNLKTGDSYNYDPWPESYDRGNHINDEFNHTSQGKICFDSYEEMQSNIIWMPETSIKNQ